MDAVSDRDFVVEVLAAVALSMVHLSRLAEEITWWSNPAFGFVRVADAFSTGSSMMPNKRNPDPAELVRGRAARVIAAAGAVLGILKGLPLTYQRDLQETIPPLIAAVSGYEASLGIMAGLIDTLAIDARRMRGAAGEGFTTATAAADALVGRGLSFRSAHHVVGALVAAAEARAAGMEAVTDAEVEAALRSVDDATAAEMAAGGARAAADVIRAATTIEGAIAAMDVIGGTAPALVRAALATVRERLGPG